MISFLLHAWFYGSLVMTLIICSALALSSRPTDLE